MRKIKHKMCNKKDESIRKIHLINNYFGKGLKCS